jgi:hypothetical protein
MSSGLVPVTNAIPAVLEFTDDACAALALPDDASDLAGRVWELVQSAELFAERSAAAAARVRRQTANDLVIPAELALLAETA